MRVHISIDQTDKMLRDIILMLARSIVCNDSSADSSLQRSAALQLLPCVLLLSKTLSIDSSSFMHRNRVTG